MPAPSLCYLINSHNSCKFKLSWKSGRKSGRKKKKKRYQESAPCRAKLVALSPLHARHACHNFFMPGDQYCHRDGHFLGDATLLLVHANPVQLLLLAHFPPHWEGWRQHLPSSWLTSPPPFTFLGGFLPTLWCAELGQQERSRGFQKQTQCRGPGCLSPCL